MLYDERYWTLFPFLLAEKLPQFTCYLCTIHVMLGCQSRDHAKKRKENTHHGHKPLLFILVLEIRAPPLPVLSLAHECRQQP
jgi:hypothetical protein